MQHWSRKKGMMVSMWDLIQGVCSRDVKHNLLLIYNVEYTGHQSHAKF